MGQQKLEGLAGLEFHAAQVHLAERLQQRLHQVVSAN
jgi:hypothetical protein